MNKGTLLANHIDARTTKVTALSDLVERARVKACEKGLGYLATVVLNPNDVDFNWEEAFFYIKEVLGENWEIAPTLPETE